MIVGLSTRTMGIDAKNRLLKKAGTVDPEDPKLAGGEPKGNGI